MIDRTSEVKVDREQSEKNQDLVNHLADRVKRKNGSAKRLVPDLFHSVSCGVAFLYLHKASYVYNKMLRRPHTIWFGLILIVVTQFAQAQSKKQGSFRSVYQSTTQTRVLLDSARYLAGSAPLRAIDKVNMAIEQSINANDRELEGACYLILGNIQQGLDQHALAVENYRKCIAALSPNGKSKVMKGGELVSPETRGNLFNAYRSMASSELQLGNTAAALRAIEACFGSRFSGISAAEQAEARRVQAAVLARDGRQAEALDLFQNLLAQAQKNNDPVGKIKTLLALGAWYEEQKNENKALEYYDQAKSVAEKEKQTDLLLKSNNALAAIYRRQKNLAKEVQTRNSNLELSNSSKFAKEAEVQNKEIGNAYIQANQVEMALPFLEKSLSKEDLILAEKGLFGKSNDLESMAGTYRLLAEQYLRMGDSQRALLYLDNFVKIQDSIRSIRSRELDAALRLSNQLGKNQQRIDLLEKERNLSERSIEVLRQDRELKEEQLSSRNLIIGSMCVLILFMAAGAFFILRSSREKRRANQLLAIRSLRGQMNPHFIFNALNSVNHYISQNDELAANKYLSDFSRLMRLVMETTRHDLIPLSDELEILNLYLQLEHARFRDHFDYNFEIDPNLDAQDFELPPMLIQPFIENAVWHGLRYLDGKGLLNIHISSQANGLKVVITDNGIGRKRSLEIKTRNQKLQNSTGMQNIDHRIRVMNELFRTHIRAEVSDAAESETNPGTRVQLYIPKNIHRHA